MSDPCISFTEQTSFWNAFSPEELVEKYGSPLYVYQEAMLRARCREIRNLVRYPNFEVHYSAKANSNLHLLKIIREEGLKVDAMSPGEIALEEKAGFTADEIFYVSNNISPEDLQLAAGKGILICADALEQVELLGMIAPGSRFCIRLNTGVGDGHSAQVVTAGHNTKFGIDPQQLDQVRALAQRYQLKWVGVQQHVGSLFMQSERFLESVRVLLQICRKIPGLEIIDLGGGFGVPYHIRDNEARLDLKALGEELDRLIDSFAADYGTAVKLFVEPGRYIVAECGVLLGTVHAVKEVYGKKYVGTDLGFNVLVRPVMYGSYHEVELYRKNDAKAAVPDNETSENEALEVVSVVGNICESGDYIAKDRLLPQVRRGDRIGVMTAGAYGYSMASNYNQRLRPAEVLLTENGEARLIRRRDTIEDLLAAF